MTSSFKTAALLSLLLACPLAAQAGAARDDGATHYRPTGKGHAELDNDAGASARKAAAKVVKTPSNGILYHGGPVMNNVNGTNVYYIWYGNWTGSTTPAILTDLASNLTGSPWWNINTSYADGAGKKVVNRVNWLGSTTDSYSLGAALSDANVKTVVTSAITSGRLPSDANGIYVVLSSADVNETSGLCTQYCGWHSAATLGAVVIKYAFVGNPDRCPTACGTQTSGPNSNTGADAMASIVAHELAETVSDPQLNAWYDSRGYENADKCAWTYGATYTAANGAVANLKLGARDFLLQQNWVNAAGGACAKAY